MYLEVSFAITLKVKQEKCKIHRRGCGISLARRDYPSLLSISSFFWSTWIKVSSFFCSLVQIQQESSRHVVALTPVVIYPRILYLKPYVWE